MSVFSQNSMVLWRQYVSDKYTFHKVRDEVDTQNPYKRRCSSNRYSLLEMNSKAKHSPIMFFYIIRFPQ